MNDLDRLIFQLKEMEESGEDTEKLRDEITDLQMNILVGQLLD